VGDAAPVPPPVARWLARADYEPTWRAMQRYTESRGADARDELWCLEHPPVYTLGLNGKPEHVLAAGDIPVVQIDRGGQVTYHGPGQLVVYPLVDLRRSKLGVRELVTALEDAIVAYAAELGVAAASRRDAPGVYVDGRKLASLGLRIRRGCSYHGLALNVGMDLEPFRRINPCGYAGLEVVDLATLGARVSVEQAAAGLLPHLWRTLRLPGAPQWAEAPLAA
jgi:lipoyl(octanoyl) transferase